ncbi:MAG TPA: riboflavin biosynthesis protein RibF [Candidatus Coproplasma excrementipullorum]|nr:riboflavin biosynthesis protein RibF [Candidatus Coproplasma excrementipullorum]
MLEIIEYGKDEYSFPSLLVLGCFDAIHAGHRELFKKAKLQAKINGLDLGVMMFRDGKGGKVVYSFEERVEMLKAYNVKFVLVIDYTPEFKQTMPLDFLAAIEEKVNVKAYMSGKDFRFGKGTKGKSSTLKNYAEDEENGVWYMPVKDVVSDGEKISTTLIKACLDEGNVKRASELLGENFFVEGQVVEGAHRGAGVLGFPTVNLTYPDWKYPVKHGVYKVAVTVEDGQYLGIANFGGRPTFGDDSEILEVHIKDFEGDLYGKTVKVGFVGYMRDIRKFEDAAALAAQLEQDKSALSLSDEEFFTRYPLEEGEPAVEEIITEEVAEECAPLPEVFEGAPVEEVELEVENRQPVPVEEECIAEQTAEEQEPAEENINLAEPTAADEVAEAPEAEPVEETAVEIAVDETVPEEAVIEEMLSEAISEEPVVEETTEEKSEELAAEEQTGDDAEEIITEGIDHLAIADQITPAWQLLSEMADGEAIEPTPSEAVESADTQSAPVGEGAEESAEEPTESVEEAEIGEEATVAVAEEVEIVEAASEEVIEETEAVEEATEGIAEEVSEEVAEEVPVEETTEEVIEASEPVEEATEEAAEWAEPVEEVDISEVTYEEISTPAPDEEQVSDEEHSSEEQPSEAEQTSEEEETTAEEQSPDEENLSDEGHSSDEEQEQTEQTEDEPAEAVVQEECEDAGAEYSEKEDND